MLNIPVYLLETLAALYEHDTLDKAANKLQITQPAMTKQLQRLEQISPFPLFVTTGRRKTFTDYGQQLAMTAQKHLLALSNDAEKIKRTHSDGSHVELKIGGRLEFLTRYMKNVTGFKGTFHFMNRSSSEVIADLIDKKLDLAITHKTDEKLEYLQKKIGSDEAALLIPISWNAPTSVKSFFKVASDHPTVIYSYDMLKSQSVFSNLKIKYVISDWLQVENLVHEQKAWAIVPKSFSQKNRGYKILDLSELSIFNDYYLYYRPELAKLDWFKKIISEIIEP